MKVIAPAHDALLIGAPDDQIVDAAGTTQQAMAAASAAVLDGFALTSDAKVIRYPDRYTDPRGTHMWNTVQAIFGSPILYGEPGMFNLDYLHCPTPSSARTSNSVTRSLGDRAVNTSVAPVGLDFSGSPFTGRGPSSGFVAGVKAGMQRRSRDLTIPTKALRRFRIQRHAYYQALQALETTRLITVDRRPGRKACMTIVTTDEKTKTEQSEETRSCSSCICPEHFGSEIASGRRSSGLFWMYISLKQEVLRLAARFDIAIHEQLARWILFIVGDTKAWVSVVVVVLTVDTDREFIPSSDENLRIHHVQRVPSRLKHLRGRPDWVRSPWRTLINPQLRGRGGLSPRPTNRLISMSRPVMPTVTPCSHR